MIQALIGPISSLAGTWLQGKVEKTKAEAQAIVTAEVEAAKAAWDALSDEDKAALPGRRTDITLP